MGGGLQSTGLPGFIGLFVSTSPTEKTPGRIASIILAEEMVQARLGRPGGLDPPLVRAAIPVKLLAAGLPLPFADPSRRPGGLPRELPRS